MVDVDVLSRNLVAGATRFADRAARLARGIALLVGLIVVSAYLTGLAGLEGGARSAWMVIGGGLAVVVLGAPLLAIRRLKAIVRHTTELVAEVVRLLTGHPQAQRVVIDIEEAEDGQLSPPAGVTITHGAPGTPVNPAVVMQAQRYRDLRQIVSTSDDLRQLPAAMIAITSFPGLIAIGLMGAALFGLLGFVFLLAWAF